MGDWYTGDYIDDLGAPNFEWPNPRVEVEPVNLMVVVNSDTFDPEDTIFPVVAKMAQNPHIGKIAIVDKNDNPGYFNDFDGDISELNVRYTGEDFSYDAFFNARIEQADGSEFNAGWSRFDPPQGYDMPRLYAQLQEDFDIPFYNNLDHMIDMGSKGKLIEIQDSLLSGEGHRYIPQSRTLNRVEEIQAFANELGKDVVVKSFYGSGGREVFRLSEFADDSDLRQFIDSVGGQVYVQEFVKMNKAYDDRVFLIVDPETGLLEAKGAVRRVAAGDGWKSNLSQGGGKEAVELDERHYELARVLGRVLQNKGILFAGVDVMYDDEDLDELGRPRLKIAEINVRNVGGLVEAEQVNGIDLTGVVSDGLIQAIREDFVLKQVPALVKNFALHGNDDRVRFFHEEFPRMKPEPLQIAA